MNEPILVPRPRTISLGDQVHSGQRLVHATAEDLPPEGYRIDMSPDEVVVSAGDPAGHFYARQTITQLARCHGGHLPAGRVEDWPDFAVRGVMLDVSRDKVPEIPTLLALIDRLSEWKVNHLQLYSEHTFAYADHEDVWREASPYTAAEIRMIDGYCRGRNIELAPNQNCLGHMERWLAHHRYRSLALQPEGFEFVGTHRGPSTLDPADDDAFAFVRSLLAELLPNFSSRRVNVGLDEPWELDTGDLDQYLGWVQRLRDCPELEGYEMLMWGDILRGRVDDIAALPERVTVCEWGYESDHPFEQNLSALAEAGRTFWACPGTSSWITILGRFTNARGNIHAAVSAAARHGGQGILNTDWGDLGHLQYLPISLPPLACGAAVSWCLEANQDLDVAAALDHHLFGDRSGTLGAVLVELGDVHLALPTQMWNMSLLAMPLYMPKLVLGRGPATGVRTEDYLKARHVLKACRARLKGCSFEAAPTGVPECRTVAAAAASPPGNDDMGSADHGAARASGTDDPAGAGVDGGGVVVAGVGDPIQGELVVDELNNAIDLMIVLCDDAVARLGHGDGSLESIPEQDRLELARRLVPIIDEHRRLWMHRNRPGGLDDSCMRLIRLQHCYETGSTESVPLYG